VQFVTQQGWQEAVTSVRDLDRWIEALDYLAGWSLVHRGAADPRLLNAWHLPTEVTATEAVLVCEQDPSRWLRLMAFSGADQQQIRSSGQAWESGGIFSLLCYCRDTQAAFERAQELGWSAHNDPVLMEFGDAELLNVVLRGPDGCNFGLYQSLKPVAPTPPVFPKLGPPFTGQQMVREIAAAEGFYRDVLGWTSWFSDALRLSCNNFGIPSNMVGVHPKHVAIMDANERRHGQVELVQWTGFEGRDFSARAVPPNLGHLALRWPVEDLEQYLGRLGDAGLAVFAPPTRCLLAPIGEVLLCSLRTPDGAIVDLIQSDA